MEAVALTKEEKVRRYEAWNKAAQKGQTVFAGSSLMEMFPIEKFVREEGLPVTVYNRGVGGYVTEELLENLGPCILELAPSRLFLNIGTNDLSDPQKPLETMLQTYGTILTRIRLALPDCRIYLMAYYPVNYEAATEEMKVCLKIRTNEKICRANEGVKALAPQYRAQYIDVNQPLLDGAGNLRAEYTLEGMHLNEQAYRAVYPLLKPYLLA